MNMDSDDRSKGNNDEKEFTISFKVFEHWDQSKRCSFLKLAKPGEVSCKRNLQLGTQDYPSVCLKKESVANTHALNIMCSINHHNIVSLKGVGPKSEGHFLVFIEECDGVIEPLMWKVLCDEDWLTPSYTFQNILSQIIEGVDFLRRNGTYHGNLTWKTTFYKHPYTVKLCNFKGNDSVEVESSQWQDWIFILQMLKEASAKVVQANQARQSNSKLFCGGIDALIQLIEGSDRNSLHLMKNIVLEDVLFWTRGRRTRFIMTTVSELMLDFKFCDEINNSAVCDVPWNSNGINGRLSGDDAARFAALLVHCNDYRAQLVPKLPALDPEKKTDYVRLACAAYTHQHQEEIKKICEGQVDFIFRQKYPMLFIELNRIIRDLGSLHHFLGISVTLSPAGLLLSQRQYALDLLQRAGLPVHA